MEKLTFKQYLIEYRTDRGTQELIQQDAQRKQAVKQASAERQGTQANFKGIRKGDVFTYKGKMFPITAEGLSVEGVRPHGLPLEDGKFIPHARFKNTGKQTELGKRIFTL